MKLIAVAAMLVSAPAICDQADEWTTTVYAARISGESTWHHVLRDPFNVQYVDSYLVAGALARPYVAFFRNDSLRLEAEAQLAYNFGAQDHWEINAMPIVSRWSRFPWSEHLATSIAFGLGVSYATELPEVEVQLEGSSHHWLIYWALEVTVGPPEAAWNIVMRLHHRSVAWGLMGEDGGVNAVGLGLRYRFGGRR
jgi:hypothetical protein